MLISSDGNKLRRTVLICFTSVCRHSVVEVNVIWTLCIDAHVFMFCIIPYHSSDCMLMLWLPYIAMWSQFVHEDSNYNLLTTGLVTCGFVAKLEWYIHTFECQWLGMLQCFVWLVITLLGEKIIHEFSNPILEFSRCFWS